MNDGRPRLGVSACLLGEPVRYDGDHKRERVLIDTFGPHVEWVPVCPEVGCGLPVPRDTIRLVGDRADPRLLVGRTGKDLTGQMDAWIDRKLTELAKQDLAGFIFKSRSPSCGVEQVKVYPSNEEGAVATLDGTGLFARAFMDRFGGLPVEEEINLLDADQRQNFLVRILRHTRDR